MRSIRIGEDVLAPDGSRLGRIERIVVDEDGHRVAVGDPPSEVVQQGHFETGRPAGVPHGTPMTIPLALRFPMLPLPVGGYAFVLRIDGAEEARVSFRVQPVA